MPVYSAAASPAVLFTKVSAQMERRATALITGEFDRLLADFVFPIPVEMPSSRLIVRSPDQGRAMLALWRLALIERGVIALKSRVIAQDMPRGGRFRVWVDYHEMSSAGPTGLYTSVLYYCRVIPTGFRIEMVSYPHVSMPELNPQFAALAMTA
jgi:hypothetical protein